MPTPLTKRVAGELESRDSNLASSWRRLNRVAIRLGMAFGPTGAVIHLMMYTTTQRPAYIVMSVASVGIAAAGAVAAHRRSDDAGWVLVFSATTIGAAGTLVPPLVRGSMVAAIAVVATIAMLILPDPRRRGYVTIISLHVAGLAVWPSLGLATPGEAMATAAIALPSLVFGLLAGGLTRATLERSERTRIEIFRQVPVGLFRSSPAGRIIDANPAVAEMLGIDRDDLLGRTVGSLHADPQEWKDLVAELEATDQPTRFAQRMVRTDGQVIWVRGVASAVRNPEGDVLYHEGAIEDNTQRREAEEEARLNAARFRNVFERAPIALWEEDFSRVARRLDDLRRRGVSDLRSYFELHPSEVRVLLGLVDYLDVNPAGVDLIGASSREEALRRVVPDIPSPEVTVAFTEQFCALWDGQDHLDLEVTGRTVDGAPIDLSLSWAAARHEDGTIDASRVIVALTDVGVVKRAERELAALVASKDELVASVSHELRTPITTILGMAFELRDHSGAFSTQERAGLIDLIAEQSRELSNIVDDLLVAARADLDTLVVRPEVVAIAPAVAQIVTTTMRDSVPTIQIAADVTAWVDPLRFRQIVRNLLTNAERYGGGTVRVEGGASSNGSTWLRVIDDGAGIPAEDREAVFQPYTRARSDHAPPGSMGLGLPVSRRLARLMGGDLVYRYDGGSVFELTLPAPARGAVAV
jgi:PAS domain S-box-containing protein